LGGKPYCDQVVDELIDSFSRRDHGGGTTGDVEYYAGLRDFLAMASRSLLKEWRISLFFAWNDFIRVTVHIR
jgi:hypothetical protein